MIRKFLAILAIFATLLVGSPAPVQAAASDCPNGRFCTWNNVNYGGTWWEWNVGTIRQQPNGCLNVTASANNNASSLYNRVGLINTVLRIHRNVNCSDSGTSIATSEMDADLNWSPGIVSFGDVISSFSARAS